MVKGFAAGARAARSLAMALVLLPALAACSYGVGDLFGDSPPPPPPPVFVPKAEGEGAGADAAQDVQAAESFPNLGQVPQRPVPDTTPAERQQVADQLAADRQHAQYTREQLTGVMSDGGAPPARPSQPPPSPPPAEAAAPSTPAPTTQAPATPAPATPAPTTTAAASQDTAPPASPAADPPPRADPQPAQASAAPSVTGAAAATAAVAETAQPGFVPAPPSADADEVENIRRVAESRAALTAGTERGSEMVSREEQPVLQRTERLTAALNDPAADSTQVEQFTRRMAEGSPAARAVAPGGDRPGAYRPAAPMADRYEADGVVSSRYADQLLAAQAGAELDAYAVDQMAAAQREARQIQSAQSQAVTETVSSSGRTPEPQLRTATVAAVTTTTLPSDETAELEAAAQRALDRQARGAEVTVSEQTDVVREVTPEGRVTTVTTETDTIYATVPTPPAVPMQPVQPPRPQTLTEIYEAQLRAASATSLQQAAQEGTVVAALPMAPQPMPQRLPAASGAGAGSYGAGTVVVSGSGVSHGQAGPMTGATAAIPGAAFPGAALPGMAAHGGEGIKAGTIRFGVGSSRLGSNDQAVLRRIADRYRDHGGMVRVVGHASSRTGDMPPDEHRTVNFETSMARAEAVARQLQQYGVPAQAMIVEARSDLEPIYYEAMPAAEAANRRAEIYFIR